MPDNEQAAVDPSPTFGEELRKQREIRGISLKEIADATKIGKRYLEAIEKNDFAALPAPVFSRGFVREYARYLGLTPDEMVDRYMHFVRSDAERNQELPESLRERGSMVEIPSRAGRNLWIFALVLFILTAGIWWFTVAARKKGSASGRGGGINRSSPASVRPEARSSPANSTARPASAGDLTLNMKIRENSWITLQIDGKDTINDELRAGTEQVLKAKREFHFKTIGNAGGVDLVLNGKPLPSLGRSGAVVHDRVFGIEPSGSSVEGPGVPPSE